MNYSFSYEDRISEINNDLAQYNQLKQLSSMEFEIVSIPESLINTVENALVVAIYSLSEQLLKNRIYTILDVEFEEENQTHKDKYVLKQMDPDSHPVTPSLDRITAELRTFYPKFKLYTPCVVEAYVKAYKSLLDARHKYAHANRHTQDIDFGYALKFI